MATKKIKQADICPNSIFKHNFAESQFVSTSTNSNSII